MDIFTGLQMIESIFCRFKGDIKRGLCVYAYLYPPEKDGYTQFPGFCSTRGPCKNWIIKQDFKDKMPEGLNLKGLSLNESQQVPEHQGQSIEKSCKMLKLQNK